jgi:hypothetical protein
MKSNYKIYSDKKIIIETLSEDISPNLYTKLKHNQFLEKNFNRNFGLITDLRNLKSVSDKELIQNIIDIFKENKGKANRCKSALIVCNKDFLKNINLTLAKGKKQTGEIKSFTEINEAENWLK